VSPIDKAREKVAEAEAVVRELSGTGCSRRLARLVLWLCQRELARAIDEAVAEGRD
jgi:hypothetical protein